MHHSVFCVFLLFLFLCAPLLSVHLLSHDVFLLLVVIANVTAGFLWIRPIEHARKFAAYDAVG